MYEDQINRALGVHEHKNNVREHFYCVKQMFDLYKTVDQLKALSARPDIDTMCAWDYNRMKTAMLNGNAGSFADCHPESQGISVPKMEWKGIFKYRWLNQKLIPWLLYLKTIDLNLLLVLYVVSACAMLLD